MLLGCFTNCLPFLLPLDLALFVAAFSAGESAFHAASGKYLFLPLDLDPSEVLHFCLVQFLRLLCDLANAISSCTLPQLSCSVMPEAVLFWLTTGLDVHPWTQL